MLAALALFLRIAFCPGLRDPELRTSNSEPRVPTPDPRLPTQDPRPPSPGSWIRLGAALGCCGMLVHSFFDFNLHIPANAAWFAVLAGLATTGVGDRGSGTGGQGSEGIWN